MLAGLGAALELGFNDDLSLYENWEIVQVWSESSGLPTGIEITPDELFMKFAGQDESMERTIPTKQTADIR